MIKNTYGIYLIDSDNKLLVATSTGQPKKSMTIPKGGKEAGETDWEAAVREFHEEAGIDLNEMEEHIGWKYALPPVRYKSGAKILWSFVVKLLTPLEGTHFECTTYTDKGKPEVYNHRLVKPEHAFQHLHEAQVRAFHNYFTIMLFLSMNNLKEEIAS
jgi:8-oxo-dGTP pyrophosphatase MutT (NUDIX family)